MPLTVRVLSSANPSDVALIPAIARIHLAAWLTNSLYKAIYYGPASSHPAIVEANRQRHHVTLTTNPRARFAVVIDDQLDANDDEGGTDHHHEASIRPSQVIAWVKYDVFESVRSAEERTDTSERVWPPYTNLNLVSSFWNSVVASRQRHSKEIGPHMSVDLLATDPGHHRRGAARILMQHVVEEADTLGLVTTIEGGPEGLKLYSDVGFVPVDEVWTDLLRFTGGDDKGQDWNDKGARVPGRGDGWYKLVIMMRQPIPRAVEQRYSPLVLDEK